MPRDALELERIQHWMQALVMDPDGVRCGLRNPVNTYISAVREYRHMDIPVVALAFVAVYRHNYRVWRIDLDAQRFTLLAAVHRRESLASALDLCASLPETDPASLMAAVGGWFSEWTSEGLFCGASLFASVSS